MSGQSDIFKHLKLRGKPTKGTDHLPAGYSSNSSAGYYSEKFAKMLIPILDDLDPDTQLKRKEFKPAAGESIHTLYLKIYQSWRYIIEKMDTPDQKYKRLRDRIQIKRHKFRVSFIWVTDKTTRGFDSTTIEVDEHADSTCALNWREELMEWLTMSEDPSPPIEKSIALNNEDIDWISGYLCGHDNVVIIRCDSRGYKVVKNSTLAVAVKRERL